MKIGLIIYSQTGNTRQVAKRLQESLSKAGHEVVLEEIIIKGETPAQPGKFELVETPDPNLFEAVIFGAPVQAFSLNPVMKAYFEQLTQLKGQQVALFVTKRLPLLVTGGTGSIAHMKKVCEEKGARVVGTEIVIWADKKREASIRQCVDKFTRLF